jgi:hypothetical protein
MLVGWPQIQRNALLLLVTVSPVGAVPILGDATMDPLSPSQGFYLAPVDGNLAAVP